MRRPLLLILTLIIWVPVADAQRRPRGFGKLSIHSMTDGATVFVDGKEMGTLPLAAPLILPAGKHTLKLNKQGFTEYMDVFEVGRNKTTELDVDLLPFAGVVTVTCNVPEARVFIDGQFAGMAPVEKEALIGERTIKVSKPGYYEFIRKIKAIAGQVQRVEVELKAMPIGTTPYRPPPPPPPKWYEKWYIWAGAAGGVAALTMAIVIPVVVLSQDEISDFDAPFRWTTSGLHQH